MNLQPSLSLPSSASSSPRLMSHQSLAPVDPSIRHRSKSRSRSRSPSYPVALEEELLKEKDRSRRSTSTALGRRERSASVLSEGVGVSVSRGGISSNSALFAREVEMSKKARDPQLPKSKAAPSHSRTNSLNPAQPSTSNKNKRPFGMNPCSILSCLVDFPHWRE